MTDRTSGHPTIEVVQAGASGPAAPGTAGTSSVLAGGIYNLTPPTLTNGQQAAEQFDASGNLKVALATSTGTIVATGQASADGVGAATVTIRTSAFDYTFNGTTWDRTKKPNAVSRLAAAAASINATIVKASAGDVFRITGFNAAVATYLNLYNKATTPAPATDNALLLTRFYLPANAPFSFDLGALYFPAGISYALVTGNAETDASAVLASAVLGLNIIYQ